MFTWEAAQQYLRERRVRLLRRPRRSADGLQGHNEVMAAQSDLVEPLARFEPRLVKMAPSGEPPED